MQERNETNWHLDSISRYQAFSDLELALYGRKFYMD